MRSQIIHATRSPSQSCHTPPVSPTGGSSEKGVAIARPLSSASAAVDYYVLRDRAVLARLARFATTFERARARDCELDAKQQLSHLIPTDVLAIAGAHLHAMVPVRLLLAGRGVPSSFAHICVPLAGDLRASRHSAASTCEGLLDSEQVPQQEQNELLEPRAASCASLFYNTPDPHSPIASSSRPLIGYVLAGDFSFVEARGVALGFVSLIGLLQLASSQLANCAAFASASASASHDGASQVIVHQSLMLRESFGPVSACTSCPPSTRAVAALEQCSIAAMAAAAAAEDRSHVRPSSTSSHATILDPCGSQIASGASCASDSRVCSGAGLVSLVRNHSSRRYMCARLAVLEQPMCPPWLVTLLTCIVLLADALELFSARIHVPLIAHASLPVYWLLACFSSYCILRFLLCVTLLGESSSKCLPVLINSCKVCDIGARLSSSSPPTLSLVSHARNVWYGYFDFLK